MMNLSDIFANAQGQEAMRALSQQFGLSAQQTEAAVAALLPAFSVGLQNQAKSAEAFQNLIGSFAGGQHLAAFEYPKLAMNSDMMGASNAFLEQIFGGAQQQTQQIQDQVVRQAAAVSGIGTAILAKMLPVIASMILGGLFKGAMNNGLGGLLEQLLRSTLGGAGGGMGMPRGAPPEQSPMPDNPLGDLLGSIFGNATGQSGQQGQPADTRTNDPVSAGIDILRDMFKTGQQVQNQQAETMENIFDQILKSQKK